MNEGVVDRRMNGPFDSRFQAKALQEAEIQDAGWLDAIKFLCEEDAADWRRRREMAAVVLPTSPEVNSRADHGDD